MPVKPLQLLHYPLRSLAILVALVTGIGLVLEYANLSLTLEEAHGPLIQKIESTTDRTIRIDGNVRLAISFTPELLIERIHISNKSSFDNNDFITISKIEVQVSLLPLLTGHLHLGNISADHTTINLKQNKDGSNNWSFDTPTRARSQQAESEPPSKDSFISQLSLDFFQLTNININYIDETRGQVINKKLDRLLVDITDKSHPIAEVSGSAQDYSYLLTFESDPLKLLKQGKPWHLRGTGQIANSNITLKLNAKSVKNEINAHLELEAKNIDLGQFLETFGIIEGRSSTAQSLYINARVRGDDFADLYEHATIELQLNNGYWLLSKPGKDVTKRLSFSKVSSTISWYKPVDLNIQGSLDEEVVAIAFSTNTLSTFFNQPDKLLINLESNIADTEININGALDLPVDTNRLQLDISIKGKDLERLNTPLDAHLPPFNNYDLKGKLQMNERGFILRDIDATIGESDLKGSIIIETQRDKPLWTVNLKSSQLRLKDFVIDDLEAQDDEDEKKRASGKDATTPEADKTYRQIVYAIVSELGEVVRAPKSHLLLNASMDKILLKTESLGNASFRFEFADNYIALKKASIDTDAGSIKTSISLHITSDTIKGHYELNTEKLDYGLLASKIDPALELGGMMSSRIDIDFAGSNEDFTHWLDDSSGHIDFALWPTNTKSARVLDLWATNLYLILLPDLKKDEDKVNCMVSLTSLDDGIMKEDFFAIDTTKLWINGNINVDFKDDYVRVALFPRSKTARLFSLQSPIRAEGSFDKIRLATNPLDITGTYISFITSPLHVPARWIFEGKIPPDGSAICEKFFDRDYVTKLNEEIKQKEQDEIKEILDSDY